MNGSLRREWAPAGSRIAIAVSCGVLLVLLAAQWIVVLAHPDVLSAEWGEDYGFFVDVGRRLVSGEGFYLARQLDGPYVVEAGVDVLYPPPAVFLLAPLAFLPAFLWWAIPLGILGWSVWSYRPARRAWPLILLALALPRSQSMIVWGSSSLWVPAFVALGLRFGWPAVLVLVKPSFLPFALVGIRNRSWWIGVVVFGLVNLALLPLWFDYLAAMRNAAPWSPGLLYSIADYPMAAVPLIAWATSRRATSTAGSRQGLPPLTGFLPRFARGRAG